MYIYSYIYIENMFQTTNQMQFAGFVRMNVSPPSGTDKSDEEPTPMTQSMQSLQSMRCLADLFGASGANLWKDHRGPTFSTLSQSFYGRKCRTLDMNFNGVAE